MFYFFLNCILQECYIGSLFIYCFFSGPYASSVLGFSVYISNTTDKSQGILCFKDKNFTKSTIPAVFTTTCPVHGQYVIYYNERLSNVTYSKEYSAFAQNNLCEVEVYGKCIVLLFSLGVFFCYNIHVLNMIKSPKQSLDTFCVCTFLTCFLLNP